MSYVVAVIVTMRRPRELGTLLAAIEEQRRRPDLTIVVENAPDVETREVLERHPAVCHLASDRNLGGAGGFAFGIYAALAQGATHLWLMDDDGLPADADCLDELLRESLASQADVVSPVILDIDDLDRLAFPYFYKGRRFETWNEVRAHPRIPRFAHLFNGALIRAEAFSRFGVPDYRLFLRGDEVDFLHSVCRGGGLVTTLTSVGFRHPSGQAETVPILGGRLHTVVPVGDFKQFHFFRNRGYLVRRHRLVRHALSDAMRYPWYYLVVRKGDWRGLMRWLGLSVRGFRGDFRPYAPAASEADAGPVGQPSAARDGRKPLSGPARHGDRPS